MAGWKKDLYSVVRGYPGKGPWRRMRKEHLGTGKHYNPFPGGDAAKDAAEFTLEFWSILRELHLGFFFCFFLLFSLNWLLILWCSFLYSSVSNCDLWFQVMLLETSRRYNPEIESITFLKDLSYNRDDFAKAGAALDRCFFLPCLVFFHLFIFHVAAGNSVCDLKLNEGFRTRAAFNRRIIAKKTRE